MAGKENATKKQQPKDEKLIKHLSNSLKTMSEVLDSTKAHARKLAKKNKDLNEKLQMIKSVVMPGNQN